VEHEEAVMMVLVENPNAGFSEKRVRLRDRLIESARASRLDQDLAAGASPDATVGLSLHAHRLVEPARRRELAESLDHLAAIADRPAGALTTRTPVAGTRIRAAAAELRAVTSRLRTDGVVAPEGVAMLRLLLADGLGPF
jgi:hypothetical protein